VAEQIVKTIRHSQGSRKVEIFRRPGGTFGFEEFKWLPDPENCWVPSGKCSTAVIDTLDNALKEVEGRVPWVTENS
jgi:hypothetical protein